MSFKRDYIRFSKVVQINNLGCHFGVEWLSVSSFKYKELFYSPMY